MENNGALREEGRKVVLKDMKIVDGKVDESIW